MHKTVTPFVFESYTFDIASKQAHFVYSVRGITFTENLTVELGGDKQISEEIVTSPAVRQILFDLHIALGMSYWKAFCPQEIVIQSGGLSIGDTEFWNTVYTKGLGEFFYHNKLDFHGAVQFPVSGTAVDAAAFSGIKNEAVSDGAGSTLVPLGGGKDSLTTVVLLQQMDIPFETMSLGQYDVVETQVQKLGIVHHRVHRQIDPQILELNRTAAALNGHVPISVIYAFTALLVAELTGQKNVVLSNEQSANIGNVEYLGEHINHQWSKSGEFEAMLREHLENHAIRTEYFSLLRPLTEWQIAKLFADHFYEWAGMFTSCNRNFTQTKQVGAVVISNGDTAVSPEHAFWCGECPKCLFVFTMLAAWIPKNELVSALGINPWNNSMNTELLAELLGISAFKPFECVGTPDEMITACEEMRETGEYENDALMILYESWREQLNFNAALQDASHISAAHYIPERFSTYLNSLQ